MSSVAASERPGPEHDERRPRELPLVEIVVPVFNEAHVLAASITRLHHYLDDRFPFAWQITIADNASTDDTWTTARSLCRSLAGVEAVHLDEKGRGRALRRVWSESSADVVAYMDVDLSTDLDALLPLVAGVVSGHRDVAIGSRLAPGARVVRGPRREAISRAYNLLLHATLHTHFRDAQCGFKAVRADAARALLPYVEDDAWFFDTEFLVLAERAGLRIQEVPVDWVDDPDSRVNVWSTARDDLKGVWRVMRHRRRGIELDSGRPPPALPVGMGQQLVRFCIVGVVLLAAGALATVVRFVLFRNWVFRPDRDPSATERV